MASIDFKKIKRQMMIYRIVQTMLTGLLVVLAILFQARFTAIGQPEQFYNSVAAAVVVQILLIWPVYKLAWRDAGIEIESSMPGLSTEQLAALRKKRMIGDLWKFCGIAFFLSFISFVPDAKKVAEAPLVLSSTIYSFLLTCLMYFQCYNFCAKKRMIGD